MWTRWAGLFLCALFAAACGEAGGADDPDGGTGGDADTDSDGDSDGDGDSDEVDPLRIYALLLHGSPDSGYSDELLELASEHFDAIGGLGNHGASFPGAIDRFREIDQTTPVLSYRGANQIHLGDDQYYPLDLVEGSFLHSADPACLKIVGFGGQAIGWFRQDVRERQINPYYDPPGVLEYLVEYAVDDGPWTQLGEPIPEEGDYLLSFVDSTLEAGREYRVRTRLTDESVVDYSWSAAAASAEGRVLAIGMLSWDQEIHALCYGPSCPSDPTEVVLEVDRNRNRVFGEESSVPEYSERWPCDTVEAQGDGGLLYSGQAGFTTSGLVAYRMVIDGDPAANLPEQGSYQWAGHNNRIQMPKFSAMLTDPSHPLWIETLVTRFADALDVGYDGLRLDFVFDTIEESWRATSLPHDWTGPGDMTLRDGMLDMLAALRESQPDALLEINGFFVVDDRENFWSYMEYADIGDVEFFGYGFTEATNLSDSTPEAMASLIQAGQLGEQLIAIAGRGVDDHVARLGGLALYLLVANEHSYFCYEIDYELFPVFPEWEVPLGAPVGDVDEPYPALYTDQGGLLSRVFENGEAHFNWSDTTVSVDLVGAAYRLAVSGGIDQLAGSDGEVNYEEIDQLDLAPYEAAILVYDPQ